MQIKRRAVPFVRRVVRARLQGWPAGTLVDEGDSDESHHVGFAVILHERKVSATADGEGGVFVEFEVSLQAAPKKPALSKPEPAIIVHSLNTERNREVIKIKGLADPDCTKSSAVVCGVEESCVTLPDDPSVPTASEWVTEFEFGVEDILFAKPADFSEMWFIEISGGPIKRPVTTEFQRCSYSQVDFIAEATAGFSLQIGGSPERDIEVFAEHGFAERGRDAALYTFIIPEFDPRTEGEVVGVDGHVVGPGHGFLFFRGSGDGGIEEADQNGQNEKE